MNPDFFDVPVRGGALRAARWGGGGTVVLGIHGITASSISLAPVARHLDEGFSLVAPDLRGRGASAALPGPTGMQVHAEDCAAVVEAVTDEPVVVVGESMGAYVGVALAAARPDVVAGLVLVDGGLPLPLPEGVDPNVILDMILGPAIERLRLEFDSRDAYLDYWRAHPAMSEDWNDDIEAYLHYDLTGEEPHLRSKVSEEAVRGDGADMIERSAAMEAALRSVTCPVHLLRAERDLMNRPASLLPDAVVDHWASVLPDFTSEVVADTNHYTIGFGARGAARVAEVVRGVAPAAAFIGTDRTGTA